MNKVKMQDSAGNEYMVPANLVESFREHDEIYIRLNKMHGHASDIMEAHYGIWCETWNKYLVD